MAISISQFSKKQAEEFSSLVGDDTIDPEDLTGLEEIEFESVQIDGIPQDILDNLGKLKTAIVEQLPQVRTILSIILKQLQESGDCLYVMTDEQIAILYDAALGEAKKVITPEKEKKAAASKKKAIKNQLDQYINAIGTGGINLADL